MKLKGLAILAMIVAMCALVVPAAAQPTPSTPFLISGCVNYSNEVPVNNPTVTIENLNTSEVFTVKTNESYNYYQTVTSSDNVSKGNILNFNASNGNVNEFNHTVTEDEINNGSFVQNITISGLANHVVISEVYVDAVNESASEWIELYNPTDSEVNISGWLIDTASHQPDATLPSGAKILPYKFYLIGDNGWIPDNSGWSTPDYYSEEIVLKNTNGWVQLKNSTGAVIDTLGWGSAIINETLSYPNNPPENESLQRKVNATINESTSYGPAWDTNNNSADFFIQTTPDPQNSGTGPVPPIPELPTLILFASGLIILAGYVLLKRRS